MSELTKPTGALEQAKELTTRILDLSTNLAALTKALPGMLGSLSEEDLAAYRQWHRKITGVEPTVP